MLTEKMMEDAIWADPEKYLKEKGLKQIARQCSIGNYRFDLLFEDRHGEKLIVEIQRGTLDRQHYLKILDYYFEYKERNPKEYIHLKVVANKISDEKRRKMRSLGIEFIEIDDEEFNIYETETSNEESHNIKLSNSLFQKSKTNRSRMANQWDESKFFAELQARKGADVASVAKKNIRVGA